MSMNQDAAGIDARTRLVSCRGTWGDVFEDGGERGDEIRRDKTVFADAIPGVIAGQAVEIHTHAGGFLGGAILRRQARDDAAQHVARAGRGHAGISGRIDVDRSFFRGDYRGSAFQHEGHTELDGEGLRDADALDFDFFLRLRDESGELPDVRCENDVDILMKQKIEMPYKREECVRIDQ
jgi:hypothetical protein